ncbi:MAG: NADPH:quinone reductase [Fimbriiglobus sp.]|jgi:NADPH2:quinone reductase|nr:NADPH:quinone reductase [Fimbriiglobus sp.]
MKAAYYETTGGPDVIRVGELPTPEPQAGEVRVKIAAAALNPVDTYIRAGLVAMPLPKPFIPGCDLAGTVDAVGPGVTRFKVGDRVWGSNQGLLGRQGTFAEYCCAGEQWLYPLPNGVKEADAAALALVGITAHLGLFWRTNLRAGETVFVNGGTGGVGMCVVQLAKAVGAKVVTTVGSEAKAQQAKELGADVILNYKTDDVVQGVKDATGGKGADVFFETLPPADFDKTVEMMAPRGRVVVMAGRQARPVFPNGPFYVKGLSLFGFVMFAMTADEQQACANDLNTWMASGALRAVIGKTFALEDAADAHRLQEENTVGKKGTLTGKIVVVPG